jgi:DNA-binding transcriptional LysR family regulator
MWPEADLREIRAFLAVSEELHFGRAAERLGVTHARVSQIIRTLEARIGSRLFDRTSRSVCLTPVGAELSATLRPILVRMLAALDAASQQAPGTAAPLRVGVTATTDLPSVGRLLDAFRLRYPGCEITVQEVDMWRPYDGLRRGEIDVLCNWLAVDEPDLTVGPVLERPERVLAVGSGHHLASRDSVSIEDLAGESVNRTPKRYPRALEDAIHPPVTPSGRPIRRTHEIASVAEIASLIARGEVVAPTMRGLRPWMGRDGIVLVPFSDLPPLPLGLIWCTAHEDARIRALAELAAGVPGCAEAISANGIALDAGADAPRSANGATDELGELRAFLTLAEELHFGRTAERLGITQSRVSQMIRALEGRLGSRLFYRTSRRVRLTPVGEQLRARIASPYRELERALVTAAEAASGVTGTLRIGMHSPVNGGPHMVRIVEVFEERYPACPVSIIDIGLVRDQLDALRAREIDMLATRLPIGQPDMTIGPILSREPRLVAVSKDHPLARLDSVGMDDIAPYPAADAPGLPREMMDAFIPPRGPDGRGMRRIRVDTMIETIMRIALGEIVHPTVRSFLDHFNHPNIVGIPLRDLPASETALVWLTENRSPRIQAFARAARDVLAHVGAGSTADGRNVPAAAGPTRPTETRTPVT